MTEAVGVSGHPSLLYQGQILGYLTHLPSRLSVVPQLALFGALEGPGGVVGSLVRRAADLFGIEAPEAGGRAGEPLANKGQTSKGRTCGRSNSG